MDSSSTNPRQAGNRGRAESFGASALDYDRIRPSYPSALIDELMSTAPGQVLDVGCGTGKAARLLIERGAEVLGVEVDDRMAEVARGHGVPVETAAFETWDAQGRQFDLLIAAQAWHWVDPVAGPVKAAQVLRRPGRLALFWSFNQFEPATIAAFDAAYAGSRIAADSVVRRGGQLTLVDHRRALADSGLFGSIEQRHYEWRLTYSRQQWLDLIATHSDHLTLPPAELGPLLERVGQAIDGLGGEVQARYRTELLSAIPV
ncbi:MAG: hypothetical protein JWO63_2735 [Frankiales bacterium]|nr:hypothetical protein [Frankiales bacterium]